MSDRFVLQVYVGSLSKLYEALSIEASKSTTAEQIVDCITDKLGLKDSSVYELAEVMGAADNGHGQESLWFEAKERRIGAHECPVALQHLWPKKVTVDGCTASGPDYRFCLRRKLMAQSTNWSFSWTDSNDSQLIRDYFLRFLYQPRDREYPDLCQLPDLTEQTLLENLKARFDKGHIYTYVGSILIAVNPFKFYPIYNPKYVQLYQNRRLGELPPHIFAIADASYQAMLRKRCNQCIVISGESGSGKTESTNLLLHHLTALSQKGTHGSGVEQTILGAGPVLEAFGNAKTKHNNNSSRFGKFILVNYKENGMVHGALVQKYLLEKSRIVSQAKSERNYHVFYYLLAGANHSDKESLNLGKPSDYNYLNQSKCYTLDGVDESYEFSRLTQSMEMVGFSPEKQHRVFRVLSAVLHLGNVQFSKKSTYHSDETVMVKNNEVLEVISRLLLVKEETLQSALTCKKTKAAKGEMLVINYKLPDAIATRDAMAKCLYGALFDWIVMQVNHALLAKKDYREHKGNYIGVLDIFGFEDFGDQNNFEQFCINFANEHLQFYFNQHVFKYEQEEYKREGINWRNIDFIDNVDCLVLIEGRPHGLLCLLDDQCNFPGASNETVLQKFVNHHKANTLFEVPPCRGSAFIIKHYAGKVKYQIRDFREKNLDLMRPDIVAVLKSSELAFVRELVGADPLALFRWQILKAFFKAYFIFSKLREMSKMRRGLHDNFAINDINGGNNFRRRSAENRRTNVMSDHQSSLTSARVSKSILSKHALFGANSMSVNAMSNMNSSSLTSSTMSPQCVRGSLIKTISSPCPLHGYQSALCSSDDKVLCKANRILMKSKSAAAQRSASRTNRGVEKSIKNLKTLKQLFGQSGAQSTGNALSHHGKAMTIGRTGHRKPTQTVTAQFHISLQQLMETLNQANPFFVRCIKSNADKIPNHFDDVLVLLQLRYTGMLETVRIRQSGYSVRLTFDEFIQHYRILLPKGLLSSQNDVKQFLLLMQLNRDNYQIGRSKIFMRESEKLVLDERLHQEILRRIMILQRWIRTRLLRKRFLEMRSAAIVIQSHTRRWLAQQRLSQLKWIANYENWAAATIQKNWRCVQMKKWYRNLRSATVTFQAHARGYLMRNQMAMKREKLSASLSASDDTFISKGSSQEELEIHPDVQYHNGEPISLPPFMPVPRNDMIVSKRLASQCSKESEESSGVHEEGDSDHEKVKLRPKITTRRLYDNRLSNRDAELPQIDISGDDQSPPVLQTDEEPRLDRRRNRPLRKLSLKRSKSAKNQDITSASIPSSQSADNHFDFQHRHVTKLVSDSTALPQSPKNKVFHVVSQPIPDTRPLTKTTADHQEHVGALQKAKKTLKTFIGIDKSLPDSKKSKKLNQLYHDITLSYDSGPEDSSLLCSSQRSSKVKGLRSPASGVIPPMGASEVSNFTLLTRHSMKSASMFHRGELCAVCENAMASGTASILMSGFKCAECKLLFHTKCLHSASQVPCTRSTIGNAPIGGTSAVSLSLSVPQSSSASLSNPSRPPRSKRKVNKSKTSQLTQQSLPPSSAPSFPQSTQSKIPLQSRSQSLHSSGSSWMVTRTAEFVDPRDILITDCAELQTMDAFLLKKICEIDEQKKKHAKESMVDVVFKQALKELKSNLISTYSVAAQDGHLHLTYKNLIDHFGQVILNVCQKENTWKSFPVIMGVNAFRGYLDELRSKTYHSHKDHLEAKDAAKDNNKKLKRKNRKKRHRNKKEEEVYEKDGHQFVSSMANIPTVCEVCSSYMWLMEKIWVCRGCKLTCHKKCATKVLVSCRDNLSIHHGKVFGAPLSSLLVDDLRTPLIVEQLITAIELKGLYTEGLYRKSGTTSKINELKQKLDDLKSPNQSPNCDFDQYSVHVLTAVLKSFFRDMPEPIMTFELYDDFLWSTAISDEQERVQAIYSHISKLPRANYDLLERLVFHLARVAQQEAANRMNANSLAIVFAPCILRTNKPMQMQDKLSDISKQTVCIECIINERLKQVKDTLADIDILDSACHTASSRLSSLRLSKLHLNREPSHPSLRVPSNGDDDEDDEEMILTQQIEHLRNEKAHLTTMLPSFRLASAGSDEDILSSTTDLDNSTNCGGSSDEVNFLPSPNNSQKSSLKCSNSGVDLSVLNNTKSNPQSQRLHHLTKHRVSVPMKRRPSRFEQKENKKCSNGRRVNDYVPKKLGESDRPVLL